MGKQAMIEFRSDRLLEMLEEMGISQPKLAEKLGVTYQGINRDIKNGKTSALKFSALCNALECNPDYLTGASDWKYKTFDLSGDWDVEDSAAQLFNTLKKGKMTADQIDALTEFVQVMIDKKLTAAQLRKLTDFVVALQ